MMRYTAFLIALTGSVFSFTIVPATQRHSTKLQMGLFDGVKEAFAAPALERSQLDADRETPIDRWMGWSVTSEQEQQAAAADMADFVDSMDPVNYISVELEKPMGIVFEENDEDYGGIFVQSLKEDGVAAVNGVLQPGDQLVSVGSTKVSGMPFDDALGAIIASELEKTTLVLFRGSAKQLYGPTGASQEWLDEFVSQFKAKEPEAVAADSEGVVKSDDTDAQAPAEEKDTAEADA